MTHIALEESSSGAPQKESLQERFESRTQELPRETRATYIAPQEDAPEEIWGGYD